LVIHEHCGISVGWTKFKVVYKFVEIVIVTVENVIVKAQPVI